MPAMADRKRTRGAATKVAALAAALVVAGGAAFAYWTAGGTGTGSAATGNTSRHHRQPDQHGRRTSHPGRPAQTLSGNFTNPNSGPVYVDLGDRQHRLGRGRLRQADLRRHRLHPDQPDVPDGHEVPPATAVDGWSGATIQFKDKAGATRTTARTPRSTSPTPGQLIDATRSGPWCMGAGPARVTSEGL